MAKTYTPEEKKQNFVNYFSYTVGIQVLVFTGCILANYLKVNLPAGNDAQKSFAKEEKAALERMQHLVALNSFLPVIKRYEDLIAEVLKPAAPVVSIVKPPAS